MNGKAILPPTPEINEVADIFDETISKFLEIKGNTATSLGTYEADIESVLLFNLVIRNVESVIVLAREDLVLYPPAMTLTRSVFEIAVNILWLLDPEDPFDREVRWLAFLREEENYNNRMSGLCEQFGVDCTHFKKRYEEINLFRTAVTSKPPSGYEIISPPNFRMKLASLNREMQYSRYVILSQFTHGTHVSTWTYRRNLGNKKSSLVSLSLLEIGCPFWIPVGIVS